MSLPASPEPSGRQLCRECEEEAVFVTPHGLLCSVHTRKRLEEDPDLWVPVRHLDFDEDGGSDPVS
jgi:hypothetical protein